MRVVFALVMSVALAMNASATTWYVADNGGSDSNSGKSQSSAFKTIQKAVDKSSSGDTIIVDDGVYGKINLYRSNGLPIGKLTIRSVNGAAVTIIDGQNSTCCQLGDEGVLEGFTLRNGSGHIYSPGGSYFRGSASIYGTLRRCVVSECKTPVVEAGAAYDCIFFKNLSSSNAEMSGGAQLYNCTIYENHGEYIAKDSIGTAFYNCIIFGDNKGRYVGPNWGNYAYNCFEKDPHFVDVESENFQLCSDSPCINAGNNSYVTSGDKDLLGENRIFGTKVDIGAYEYVPSYPVTFDVGDHVQRTSGGELTQTVKHGKSAVEPIVVAEEGYWFMGWDKDFAAITADTTIKAEVAKVNESVEGGKRTLSIAVSDGWSVYYTTDETLPTDKSTKYVDGVVIPARGSQNVKMVAKSPVGILGEVFSYVVTSPDAPLIKPASGTIIDSSLTVNISCATEGATIYYTTDGSEPTPESTVYGRFKITDKTTVKAMAYVEGLAWSQVATAEYALGTCADPVISLADGAVFQHSDQEVSITWDNTDGTLRYTLDGSEPTVESPAYEGPFTISETTTVKAKVFGNTYFDSQTVTATLTREWLVVETPVIDAAATFSGTKTTVSISCGTADAVIRYTVDGTDPNSHSPKYVGEFEVSESCTIKAYATLVDYTKSAVAKATIEKVWGIGDALNDPDRTFTTDETFGWVRDISVSKDGKESMRSGAIGNAPDGKKVETKLSTTVQGKGKVEFWWKASCEKDVDHEWDHGEFRCDGKVEYIDGTGDDWLHVEMTLETDGDHVLTWAYVKDDFGADGDDCVRVDMFTWTPAMQQDPIPEIGDEPTPEQILAALSGSADARLAAKLTTGEKYNDYRAWAGRVAGDDVAKRQQIKDSENAWLSYALDAQELIVNLPEQGDVTITSIAPVSGGVLGLVVAVDKIKIGLFATEENLREVFGIMGSKALKGDWFDDKNVSVKSVAPQEDGVRFIVEPSANVFEKEPETFLVKVIMRI